MEGLRNVSKYNARKASVNGIVFDSKLEGDYYLMLKEKLENGEIRTFERQPVFLLQDKFKKNGKTFRKIEYKADFKIIHNDGSIEIVDVKGFETPEFRLKRKLFEKRYPYTLTIVKYVKKYGGWITMDEYKKRKRDEKRGPH